jgi:hypothetical protein
VRLQSKEHIHFLKTLIKFNVAFLIIGGHAAIYHGVRRTTSDLDILVRPTKSNGEKIIASLKSLKLDVPEILPSEFESKLVLSFGLEPDGVDILNFTPGIDFEAVYKNSVLADFSGLSVRMIDIRDLIRNKESLNRPGEQALLDKYDAEVLKKIIQKKS